MLQSSDRFERIVIAGGHEKACEYQIRGCRIIGVEHDSYDYTGMIEMVRRPELMADCSHVLCVQDTMELGPHTIELCQLADPQVEATAAHSGMCNLVLYRRDYLNQIGEFILSQMNCSKLDSIKNEGQPWRMAPARKEFPAAGVVSLGFGNPYSEVPRLKEYYPSLEVVKWKANYGQNMHALIDNP